VTLVVELYCVNIDCTVRDVTVVTKDFGAPGPSRQWRCPGCGGPARIEREKTGEEDAREKDAAAMARVNELLYLRDGYDVPHSVRLDELPPEWKAVVWKK
jgi:hypothetical protein